MSDRKLSNWIESYLKYTEDSEAPYLYRVWTAYSVVAACLQRKISFSKGHITFYPNIYVLLVGPPGAKKGTAMKPGIALLREIPGVKIAAQATTKESLVRELHTSTFTDADPETMEVFIHSSMTICSEEFTVFIGYNNKELISWMCDWWDCQDPWEYQTKNMGHDCIRGIWVNMIAATTPDILILTLPQEAVGGGLMSRVICVLEEKKGKTKSIFDQSIDTDLWNTLVHDLEYISQMKGAYIASKGYQEVFDDWYYRQESNPPFTDRRLAGYVSKRATHIVKISMIASASRSSELVLEKEDFIAAREVLEKTEIKMPKTFSGFGESDMSSILAKVASTIAAYDGISFKDLLAQHYYDASKEVLRDIVATLTGMDYCSIATQPEGSFIVYNKEKGMKI